MKDVRLTKRGRIVVGIVVTIAILAVYAILNNLTMPEECRVSIHEMTEVCKTLL